ncbi:MAG: dockerin type I domain-containing protein [Ruminococcus sp.]|nr:dockerin type I domain-containing protein [Ruminococcus sp.]
MKNIKKILALLSGTAICAVSMFSTAVSADSTLTKDYKYTYRAVLESTKSNQNISDIVWSYSFAKSGNYVRPFVKALVYGSNPTTGGAGTTYYSVGSNYKADKPINSAVPILTVSVYSCKNTIKEGSKLINAKNTKGQSVSGLRFKETFLVGDLNNDKTVDGRDYSLVYDRIDVKHNYSYDAKYDINNDGKISSADSIMHHKFISGQLDRFEA